MNCIIVDDEVKNLNILTRLITDFCPDLIIQATAATVDTAFEKIIKHHPDIVFLDIEMPGGNAFSLLDKLMPITFEIIFVTAFDNYLLKAFKYAALDYLLKPVDIDELVISVSRAKSRKLKTDTHEQIKLLLHNMTTAKSSHPEKMVIPSHEGLSFVSINEVVRLESVSNYSKIYLSNNEKIVSSKCLSDFEEILPPNIFFRIHNSHIVNTTYIKKYHKGRGGYIELHNGSTIEVAARRKLHFLKMFGM